ncbi:DUF2892 domain-containing protein [Desulfuromonas acetoxidans]|uniref:Inner membrane protein YgaP-like transmembrane domain-containing protein n=1 Tax=Desulfuromonas acetoxidans (strain DSM 684 / 11070) TaxID=281689 RepID=Q1K0D7_DESA6|nr:DUF2892 domain-containing protein [Desulfuromonas acetoxidans]EAT16004.1 conserved hypothetical protein [Desulfuromonas acetoxidans DSM 684]MBF0644098.1 DUF2892 domain-containing protein [Desulfuromonas acetoxidans]NVD24603.1 DUF2892 domain-containing protein [Desulfuromonas acetoxidans]NVE16447.1 DUF2892 domain-containing protein [Desulfuromonas acetoxidans]
MTIDRMLIRVAGFMVFFSVLLAVFHNLHWLWFTGFVGANLVQASFTGFCPLVKILKKIGMKSGAAFE